MSSLGKRKKLVSLRDSRNMEAPIPGFDIGDSVICLSSDRVGTIVGFARDRVRIQFPDAIYQLSPREIKVSTSKDGPPLILDSRLAVEEVNASELASYGVKASASDPSSRTASPQDDNASSSGNRLVVSSSSSVVITRSDSAPLPSSIATTHASGSTIDSGSQNTAPEKAAPATKNGDASKVIAVDAIPDEPCVRLGCLELYVRLAVNGAGEKEGDNFVVEEDQRQRVLVHWRNKPLGVTSSAIDSNSFDLPEQTWRVSNAFSSKDADKSLSEHLGIEAIDWLFDGLSALVLAIAPTGDMESSSTSLFGRGVYASDQPIEEHDQLWPRGLIGFCFEELCRRVAAEPDKDRYCLGISVWELLGNEAKDLLAASGEDASSELRFETLEFRTAQDAFALLQAVAKASNDKAACRFDPYHHVFVRAVVIDARRGTMAALHFAQVAAIDAFQAAGSGSVDADRKVLWDLLDSASTGDALGGKESSKIADVLTPLVAGNCKPFFLCSIPERPSSKSLAAESHDLLDLAERASLITAQCTRVQGVRREDFQLTDAHTVLARLRKEASEVQRNSSKPSVQVSEVIQASDLKKTSAGEKILEVPEYAVSQAMAAATQSRYSAWSAAKVGWAPSSPRRPTFLDEAAALDNDIDGHQEQNGEISKKAIVAQKQDLEENAPIVTSTSFEERLGNAASHTQSNLGSLGARIAHAACLDECRELDEACAAVRAKNVAKAAERKRELQKVQAEVASLQEELAGFEDSCEAPELLNEFKQEIQVLRAEAARLREENAALAGAKGGEARRAAQIAVLQGLKREVAHLRASNADMEREEKHSSLVAHCLQEVRMRLDTSKRKFAESEREFLDLQPAYGELLRQIEHSERKRRWAQEELDKLRRTTGGLRAEIAQLQEVRDCVDGLPAATASRAASPNSIDGVASNVGLERFAVLQRRVAASAPQLMPLCNRARSEMEELVRCCRHLEERQRRLEQVAPVAEDGDSGGFSCNSSMISGATPRRTRSSDALALRTGPKINASPMFASSRPVAKEASRRSSSARSTPRSTTPRTSTPRGLRASSASDASSRQPSMAGYSQALKSWILERGTSQRGLQRQPQDHGSDARMSTKASSYERESSVEGAAGALRDLGLPVPAGSPHRVQGVHLRQERRSKSRERYSKERPGFSSTPVLQRSRAKT